MTCILAKHGNDDQSVYDAQIKAKDDAIAEKEKDEELGRTTDIISVWTIDLQAVLLCPNSNATTAIHRYYKTKLAFSQLYFIQPESQKGYCHVPRWKERRRRVEVSGLLIGKRSEEMIQSHIFCPRGSEILFES